MSFLTELRKLTITDQGESKYSKIAQNWATLNSATHSLSETDLLLLLKRELGVKPDRPHMLGRLHSRYSRVRSMREKKELGIITKRAAPAPKKKKKKAAKPVVEREEAA